MKKNVLLMGVMLFSLISFSQKKEINKAEKEFKSGNYAEAMASLEQAEGLLDGADTETKTRFYLVKANGLASNAGSDVEKLKMAADALLKAKEIDANGKLKGTIADDFQALKEAIESSAGEDYKAKKYKLAADKFYVAYTFSPQDTLFLFNAAVSSKIAEDYENAGTYFQKLVDLGYTGIQKQFVATEVSSGTVEPFFSKANRDIMIKAGTHKDPKEVTTDSKRELVLLSLAQVRLNQNDEEGAIRLIGMARKDNPKDMILIQAEADMVYKKGDMARYNELMQEMIAISPNNPDLYNNLGVANAKLGLNDKAIEYYNKAIELKPDNPGALINIAVLILGDEGRLNEEMNALGTSKADYAKYDELKEEKNNLYREALPYLESALNYRTDDVEIVRTLMGIYSQLGQDEKYKTMKARLQQMEGGQ